MIVFVFDFDDTLFPTTYFNSNNFSIPNEIVSKSIINLLTAALRYGKVFIITNANKDWITLCSKHLPLFNNILSAVELISVRELQLDKGLDFSLWKTEAFHQTLKPLFDNNYNHHLIAFGDNIYDHTAAVSIRNTYINVLVTSIRMCISPSLNQLLEEHKSLHSIIENFSDLEKDIDINIC